MTQNICLITQIHFCLQSVLTNILPLVNKVILVGRMGADPEVVTLDDDRKVIHYTVATSETRSDKEGEEDGYRYGHVDSNFILFYGSHGSDL
jgi:hypothetical protein